MSQERGEELQEECSFLKYLTPIGFLTEGSFEDLKDPDFPLSPDQKNPFAYWLKEKILYHRTKHELGERPLGPYATEVAGSGI